MVHGHFSRNREIADERFLLFLHWPERLAVAFQGFFLQASRHPPRSGKRVASAGFAAFGFVSFRLIDGTASSEIQPCGRGVESNGFGRDGVRA
jgi:hypothetical protein